MKPEQSRAAAALQKLVLTADLPWESMMCTERIWNCCEGSFLRIKRPFRLLLTVVPTLLPFTATWKVASAGT